MHTSPSNALPPKASTTFPKSATSWGPSFQIYKPVGDILNQANTSHLQQRSHFCSLLLIWMFWGGFLRTGGQTCVLGVWTLTPSLAALWFCFFPHSVVFPTAPSWARGFKWGGGCCICMLTCKEWYSLGLWKLREGVCNRTQLDVGRHGTLPGRVVSELCLGICEETSWRGEGGMVLWDSQVSSELWRSGWRKPRSREENNAGAEKEAGLGLTLRNWQLWGTGSAAPLSLS